MSDIGHKLTDRLRGFRDVISMNLLFDERVGYYLELLLEDQNHVRLRLFCKDISLLQMSEFGGGLTQLNWLRVEDVGSRHPARIKLEFSDLNPELLSFSCANAEITAVAKLKD